MFQLYPPNQSYGYLMTRARPLSAAAVLIVLMVALPVTGAALAGKPIGGYLKCPPQAGFVAHAPFSWPAFVVLAIACGLLLAPFIRGMFAKEPHEHGDPPTSRPYPWWGWAGLALCVAAWVLSWTRLSWFAGLQRYTFAPLWVSYVLTVNALRYRREGRCMMLDRPRFFLFLFLPSAVFWWFFEYLNGFVHSWYYLGIAHLSSTQYFILASLPFSTVLPAVIGTYELLDTPRMRARAEALLTSRLPSPRRVAIAMLVLAGAGLALIGVLPDYLFPLVWISPALIFAAIYVLRDRTFPSVMPPVLRRQIVLLPLAALICGCFWEMWNFYSLAKWKYEIPLVGGFHIFEMPLLGYLGYLPFGWECGLIAAFVERLTSERQPADASEIGRKVD